MRPGSSAVNGLREALVALKPAGPWRARAVVAEPQIQQCVALQAESFLNRGADPAPQVDRMAQRLRAASVAEMDVFLTVDAPGGCLGFLWTSLRPLPEGPVCHLNSIVLTGAARGRGLGGELMAGLEDGAKQAGFVGMSLNSMADNHRVAGFYRRLGYELVGLDLEKSLADSGSLPVDPTLRRLPPGDGVVFATRLQDAFEPAPAGSPERFEHNGELVALVGTHLRRAMDGSSIALFDPFFVTPVGFSAAIVRGIVADREHAAREQAAVRAYVTVWGPTSHLALALQGLEYKVGRHKWWKGITRSHHARAI